MKKKTTKSKIIRMSKRAYFAEHIEWDNWTKAEYNNETGETKNADKYLPISGVLYAKLEAMKELFQDYQKQDGHDAEAIEDSLDTINLVQIFINSMPDKVLNGQKFEFDPDEN